MKKEAKRFEYLKKCPVCESSFLSLFKKKTFDFLSLDEEQVKITDSQYGKIWDLSRCQNCSHIFANPCPSEDFISSLYAEVEDPLYEEEAQGRSKNFLSILIHLEKMLPQKGAIFDVGAATGIFLNIAQQRGWNVDGIEISSWAAKLAKEKYGLLLQEGSFETAELRKNHYTAVTMVDFIEHIPHPLQALSEAYDILSPDGVLCLVTPDINSMAAKIAGRKWWHFRPAHLSYFSAKSLYTLLRRSGFQVLKERKYAWTFSAHYLISRHRQFKFLLKSPFLASFWKKIQIKLALNDSFEIYAIKETRN
jgi:2-polyprenyl-3-methyl-5-hydroxy-6-metoxy-1,4-benzoquinol methylase